ncbi:phage tail domain-containing protein, partial [Secundilactobacillus pentosiphilus]|uniref:phage tail domain-containing protein n=1 Tax=Secundilactobacillus pentosiphilus TaxID=1714682 RepID=UPI000B5CC687
MSENYWTKVSVGGQVTDITTKWPLKMKEIQDQGGQYATSDITPQGMDGILHQTNTFAPFSLTITYRVHAYDNYDFQNIAFEMKQLLNQRDAYYVWTEKQPGRWYSVNKCDLTWTRVGAAVADFTLAWNVWKGYSESRLSTLDYGNLDHDSWAFSMGIDTDKVQYQFTSNQFRVYNGGIDIMPEMDMPLKWSLKCTGNPVITNNTTKRSIAYTDKPMTSDQTLSMDGVYPYLNDEHCGRSTDHGLLTLA